MTNGTLHPPLNGRRKLGTQGVFAAILGNALEFYDFIVYASYAVMIGKAFFPTQNAFVSLLLSVATFGVGFVTRPLGGLLIGAYADRRGRKPALTLTIGLMAIGSGAIGVLPTYQQIGIAAPLLLVLARLIQGFSTGGEMGPATTFLLESAPRRRRAFFGSWQFAGQGMASVAAGLIGYLLARLVSPAALNDWAWRIPFLLGILIAPVGIYIRRQMDETLDTSVAHKTTGGVMSHLARAHWLTVLLAIAMISGGTITQYFLGYMTTFALTTLHMPATTAMLATFVIGISNVVFAVVGGALGDRFGLKPVAIVPRILLLLVAYPAMLHVVDAHTPGALLLMTAMLMMLQALSTSTSLLLIPLCFPLPIRTTGLSIAYALGVTIFGGTAQVIYTWLIGTTHDPLSPLWYVIAANIVTVIATILLRQQGDTVISPAGEAQSIA